MERVFSAGAAAKPMVAAEKAVDKLSAKFKAVLNLIDFLW
jgi:hypothetical protein